MYVVDRILDVRVQSGVVQYHVKWRGWSSKDFTWEPASHLLGYGAEDLVREYHTANRDKINPLKLAYMVMNAGIQDRYSHSVPWRCACMGLPPGIGEAVQRSRFHYTRIIHKNSQNQYHFVD